MREKSGGAVTGALFTIARKLADVKPDILSKMRPLELTARIMGVSGDFVLPESEPGQLVSSDDEVGAMIPQQSLGPKRPRKLLWIAGGIGVTPFLSMLDFLTSSPHHDEWEITLILSTREPDVLLPLISAATSGQRTNFKRRVHLSLDVFSDKLIPGLDADVVLRRHVGRVPRVFFTGGSVVDLQEREVYLCGPESFEKAILAALLDANIDSRDVRREGFGY
jgi:ferredoxin-NADP reductase